MLTVSSAEHRNGCGLCRNEREPSEMQITDFDGNREVAECRRRINLRCKLQQEIGELGLAVFGALFITAMTWTGVVYWIGRLWSWAG
jgi:hypothetical protein